MQKTFKFAVTVGRSENVALEKLAQTWAAKFGVKYVERGSIFCSNWKRCNIAS